MLSMISGFRQSTISILSMILRFRRTRPFHAIYDFGTQAKRSLYDFCSSGFKQSAVFTTSVVRVLGDRALSILSMILSFRQSAIFMLSLILRFRRTRRLHGVYILNPRRTRHLHVIFNFGIQANAPSPHCLQFGFQAIAPFPCCL
jgi:hypothetical protein